MLLIIFLNFPDSEKNQIFLHTSRETKKEQILRIPQIRAGTTQPIDSPMELDHILTYNLDNIYF